MAIHIPYEMGLGFQPDSINIYRLVIQHRYGKCSIYNIYIYSIKYCRLFVLIYIYI